jgi:hypothetical protein
VGRFGKVLLVGGEASGVLFSFKVTP